MLLKGVVTVKQKNERQKMKTNLIMVNNRAALAFDRMSPAQRRAVGAAIRRLLAPRRWWAGVGNCSVTVWDRCGELAVGARSPHIPAGYPASMEGKPSAILLDWA